MSRKHATIYTRTGDGGETGLSGGKRVHKDCPQVQAIGDVDELNCAIGMVLAQDIPDDLREIILQVQHQLFNLGAELNCAQLNLISEDMVMQLERHIDDYDSQLPPLKNFILPGGGHAASLCHLARAVCRRAERSVVTVSGQQQTNANIQIYLNRLSDFLFVVSRYLSKCAGQKEIPWLGQRN